MSAELNASDNLSGHVRGATKAHKLERKKVEVKRKPTAQEASANDVRTALSQGHITPAEATGLNPLGGLIPNSKDVRNAYQSGKISREEATGLNPNADLNSTSRSSRSSSNNRTTKVNNGSPKARTRATKASATASDGPINVKSTRVSSPDSYYPSSSNTQAAIGQPQRATDRPFAIGAPGPTASESAAARAKSAAKGTKNTSSIKVAEPAVDLEEGPNFGKPVYSITDVPRQWRNNA